MSKPTSTALERQAKSDRMMQGLYAHMAKPKSDGQNTSGLSGSLGSTTVKLNLTALSSSLDASSVSTSVGITSAPSNIMGAPTSAFVPTPPLAMTGFGAGGGLTRNEVAAMIQEALEDQQLANMERMKNLMSRCVMRTDFESFCTETNAKIVSLESDLRKLDQKADSLGVLIDERCNNVRTELAKVKSDAVANVGQSHNQILKIVTDGQGVVETELKALTARIDTVQAMCNVAQQKVDDVEAKMSTIGGVTGPLAAPATSAVSPAAPAVGSTVGGGSLAPPAPPVAVVTTPLMSGPTSAGSADPSAIAAMTLSGSACVTAEDIDALEKIDGTVVSNLKDFVCSTYKIMTSNDLGRDDYVSLLQTTKLQPGVSSRVTPPNKIDNTDKLDASWIFPRTGNSMETTLGLVASKLMHTHDDEMAAYWANNLDVIMENLFLFTNDKQVTEFRDALLEVRRGTTGGTGTAGISP